MNGEITQLNMDLDKYAVLAEMYINKFGHDEVQYFSAPGRTEISGNHTDHNNGLVIAAGITLHSIACASACDDIIDICSEGYPEMFSVRLDSLKIDESETGTTNALIRGTAAGFQAHGYKIGGFKAAVSSEVLPGSGLSSSASIEVLIGTILNHLYNGNAIPAEEIAKIGQFAENKYFKKPCGLMDQMACAVGGLVAIDFADAINPVVQKIDFDFENSGYSVAIVHCGGSHVNLTADYAAIPAEMRMVAEHFGKKSCREVSPEEFVKALGALRDKLGDRAVLRAFHFFHENERVRKQVEALQKADMKTFLTLVNESGNSSYKYLQNIIPDGEKYLQPLALALALSEDFIATAGDGACRVHGGGFAGTIQCILPTSIMDAYKNTLEPVFGQGSVSILGICNTGAGRVEIQNGILTSTL